MKGKEVEVKKLRKIRRAPKVKEPKKVQLNNIETEPIPEQVIPVSYEDHIKAGFVNLSQSEGLQKQGKRVVEIKNIGGSILHRLEKI